MENTLLGAQEIFFYTLNRSSPKHFLIAAEISSQPSVRRWHDAVLMVQQRHPLLSRSIGIKNGTDLVFEPCGYLQIPLVIVDNNQAIDWKSELEKELSAGIDAEQSPLVRIKVINSNGGAKFIIVMHHSIADGMSVVYLVNDLLKALSGEKLDQLSLSQSVDAILGIEGKNLAAKIIRKLRTDRKPEIEPGPKIDYLTLGQSATAKLIQRSRAEATTVHGALQAAAALSMNILSGDIKDLVRIMSPVSFRGSLNVNCDCRPFFASKTIGLDTSMKASFWELARFAKAELAETSTIRYLADTTKKLGGLISSDNDLVEFVKNNFNFDIMLSNLGRYPFATNYGDLQLKNISGPYMISGFGKQQTIGATSVNNQLHLTNSSRHLVTGLLKTMEQVLDNACNSDNT